MDKTWADGNQWAKHKAEVHEQFLEWAEKLTVHVKRDVIAGRKVIADVAIVNEHIRCQKVWKEAVETHEKRIMKAVQRPPITHYDLPETGESEPSKSCAVIGGCKVGFSCNP